MIETKAHAHVLEERGELFHSVDGMAVEEEYAALLTALVRALKPREILETGSGLGIATAALARGVELNKFGRVTSIEHDAGYLAKAAEFVKHCGLQNLVTFVHGDSLDFLTKMDKAFDFLFFDSELSLRAAEFKICIDRWIAPPGAWAAFHDTSRLRTLGQEPDPATKVFWNTFTEIKRARWVEFPLSRGMVLAQVLPPEVMFREAD